MIDSFRIDLHVHSNRYSQCAETLDPYRIGERAIEVGLAGVLLSEHDIFWQDEEMELLRAASPGIRIYRGIEVSARGCHLVVTGLEEAAPLHRGATIEEVVSIAHDQGASVILAHPFRDADPAELAVELVDAVEVASTSFTGKEAELARHLATRFEKPMIGASDAHALVHVGWAWTRMPFLPHDEKELAAAIRDGLGVAEAPREFPA